MIFTYYCMLVIDPMSLSQAWEQFPPFQTMAWFLTWLLKLLIGVWILGTLTFLFSWVEPVLSDEFKQENPEKYQEYLNHVPDFLCLRASL
ncbi:hypothetical protein ELS19_06195 [Halogeometricum borinquense]|uniref:Uncharacterized protein n=1 Tax=Halogeometricum borinquense TaxID=60847 RepID=A0A482T723_9EURY|nr:hypothetical protein [Halogeometricum borinquense]RYJ13584.1 hypothetical protein ELS19_06195 [Halogeometricum borinquense]